jgi:hypothetical protein
VVCQACNRLHFINRSSGKLLGDQKNGTRLRVSPNSPAASGEDDRRGKGRLSRAVPSEASKRRHQAQDLAEALSR